MNDGLRDKALICMMSKVMHVSSHIKYMYVCLQLVHEFTCDHEEVTLVRCGINLSCPMMTLSLGGKVRCGSGKFQMYLQVQTFDCLTLTFIVK